MNQSQSGACSVSDPVSTGPWSGVWAACTKGAGHVESGNSRHYDKDLQVLWED